MATVTQWAPVEEATLWDDPVPPGTLEARVATDALVTLESSIPGTDVSRFSIEDDLMLYLVPIAAGDGTEHRLWKMADLAERRRGEPGDTERISWSLLRSIFSP